MLTKRIIPCLDVVNDQVVKGVQFRNHKVMGDIVEFAHRYAQEGADEIIFYDITASSSYRRVSKHWVYKVAESIDIPFCVAGGITSIKDAKEILAFGADKISINSPAISDPSLISRLSDYFGKQCIVVGIDSWYDNLSKIYKVKQYTGDEKKTKLTTWKTVDWMKKVQKLGAGEIVLNMMNRDGMCKGYDLDHLRDVRKNCQVPLIASGGIGSMNHFFDAFTHANVDGGLAASVFHKNLINIKQLKKFLLNKGVEVRLC